MINFSETMSLPHSISGLFPTICAVCLLGQTVAWGYLGSFEEQDGYRAPINGNIPSLDLAGDAKFYFLNNSANSFTGIVPASTFPSTMGDATHGPDLSRYNAGDYGTNAGGPGGIAQDITDNSGRWTALLGGRLNEDIGGFSPTHQYLGSTSGNIFLQNRDYVHAYRYTSARSGSQVLNLLAQDTNLRYDYTLDSRDFGGTAPGSTNQSLITMAFWICPPDADDPDPDNMLGLSMRDAMGQSVFEVGYTGENIMQYRLSGSSNWISTSSTVGTQGWSEVRVILNTTLDTVSYEVRAWDDLSGTLGVTNTLLSNQALGLDADALTTLRWDLRGGSLQNGAVSYKNYFDDFSFALMPVPVPEPSSAMCVLIGLSCLWRRRR
jgi:hypothetical protein